MVIKYLRGYLKDGWLFSLKSFSKLDSEGMKVFPAQYRVQELVDRKATSSYYTSLAGLKVVREFVNLIERRDGITVADPFMGSGVMLSAISDLVKPSKVIGIEINEAPCKIGRKILSSLYGSIVEVICGDAFQHGWKYRVDLIISNPPFIRWHLIDQRDRLLQKVRERGYAEFISRGDPGMHILSFFLMDYMLKEEGYIITVMPASTFYTIQGEGLKKLLTSRYNVIALVENMLEPSFSDGSGFKELILFAKKRQFGEPLNETEFYQYNGGLVRIGMINLSRLPVLASKNWLSLFNFDIAKTLINVLEELIEEGKLRYLKRNEIVRGVEMYGPEFFFIPNKYSTILREKEESIIVKCPPGVLEIPRRYLVECLRSPRHYSKIEIESAGYYILCIDDEQLEDDLRKYIKWGETMKIPALNFGKRWYQHVWMQVNSKKPFGHIFLPDKIDPTRRAVFAHYSKRPLSASKNFYIIRTDNQLIAAWFNSSFFFALFNVFSRRISEKWTRLLEDDYLSIPVPSLKMDVDFESEGVDHTIFEYLGLEDETKEKILNFVVTIRNNISFSNILKET